MINLFQVVGGPSCVAAHEGQKVFERVAAAIREGREARLSFYDISTLTAAFLSAAIGQLYGEFSEEQISALLKIEDIQQDDLALLKRVIMAAKEYFHA